MTRDDRLSSPRGHDLRTGGMSSTMFDESMITPEGPRNEDPLSKWTCRKCRTEHRGTPRQRLLDARDRWRRDWCRTCARITVMERG